MQDKYKILVVDDDEDSRKLIQSFFETKHSEKYTVHTANDGSEAITKVEELLGDGGIDLILMDIRMPFDGTKAMNIIKNIYNSNNLTTPPIIAHTAYAMIGDKEKFLQQGFDGYLSKPFLLTELNKTIKQYLNPSLN